MSLAMHREMQADVWYVEPGPNELPIANTLALKNISLRHNGNGSVPKATATVGGTV